MLGCADAAAAHSLELKESLLNNYWRGHFVFTLKHYICFSHYGGLQRIKLYKLLKNHN